jgi:hypothetical protein
MISSTPIPVAFIFYLLSSLGLPLGVPPLPETQLISRIAPEECLFYMSTSGMAAPDAKSANQTEQLLAEPEVQQRVGEIEKLIRANFNKSVGPNDLPPGLSPDEVVDLAKMLLTRPMSVYISDVQISPTGTNIRGGMAIKIGDDSEKLRAKLEQLTKTLPQEFVKNREINGEKFLSIQIPPIGSIVWGFKKNFFVAAMGDGEMESLLKRAGGKAPAWLAKIRQHLPVERVSTVGYLNVKALVKIFAPMAGPKAAVTLEALGVSNVSNIASVAGLEQSNYVSKILISIDGEPQGLMQFASIKPLSADDLKLIPADANLAFAAKINPLGFYDTYMAMGGKADPQETAFVRGNIETIGSQLGVNISQEILKPFGDNFIFYTNSSGEMGSPNMMIAVQLKDPQQAANTFSKLMPLVKTQIEIAAKRSPIPIKFDQTSISGKDVYTINVQQPGMPGGQICWCLAEKELVLTTSQQSLQTYLSGPTGIKSLAQSPDVEKLFTSDTGPTTLFYWNIQQTFNQIYPMMPLIAGMMQSKGVKLDLSMLPPQNAIGPHLTPMISSVRRTKLGIEITERTPLPGLGIVQSAPVVTAMLLPAMSASRDAAQLAASINNMKGIMLAMHNYHDAKKRFPPAYKADKDGKPLLSWRVLILPMIEQVELYNQFHLDEPWDSENNKKLIAKMPPEFRSPSSKAGEGKTNYLTVRGENTVFPGKEGVRIADITDGTAYTIAIVEASDEKAVIWTKPDDYDFDSNNPVKGLAALHPSVILAGFADGSVRPLSALLDPDVIKGLFSRNGGEVVQGKY